MILKQQTSVRAAIRIGITVYIAIQISSVYSSLPSLLYRPFLNFTPRSIAFSPSAWSLVQENPASPWTSLQHSHMSMYLWNGKRERKALTRFLCDVWQSFNDCDWWCRNTVSTKSANVTITHSYCFFASMQASFWRWRPAITTGRSSFASPINAGADKSRPSYLTTRWINPSSSSSLFSLMISWQSQLITK